MRVARLTFVPILLLAACGPWDPPPNDAGMGYCPGSDAGPVADAGPADAGVIQTQCTFNQDCPPGYYCAGDGCGTPGECMPRPLLCPDDCLLRSVCGCDGRFYCNSCLAEEEGARLAPDDSYCEPPDAGPVVCTVDAECASNQYCASSGCGTSGTCEARPVDCPQDCVWPEVCGCDGNLYCNQCLAEEAGVNVSPTNICQAPDAGPTPCTADAQCPSTQYCASPSCGTSGVCENRPVGCPLECTYPEVCGCDGNLYCNQCLAEAAGVNVSPIDICQPPDAGPTPCTIDAQCPSTQYCASSGCGTAGVCENRPVGCLLECTYPEVCGCDGNLYCNQCLAEAAGVNVSPIDICQPPDAGPTPCTIDAQCPSTQYCASSGCGTAGVCENRPVGCPLECTYPEVCGCDGNLYCNQCLAEAAGVNVSPIDICQPPDAGPTPCTIDAQCPSAQYCASSGCGTAGVCENRPTGCPLDCVVPEVCGCDGNLYCNQCLAEAAGVNVGPSYLCLTPDAGPTPCTIDAQCLSTQYCASSGCGTPGYCDNRPTGCPLDCVAPEVCGCDGNLYCNACLAEAAGVNVAPTDVCQTVDAGPTPCFVDSDCPGTQYCAGPGCGTEGTCEDRPTQCPTECSSPEICGCDGQQYCNACLAEAAGTRVGPSCEAEPDAGPTTCLTNADCPQGDYCAGTGCNTTGTCEPEPTACPQDECAAEAGVCGCDGQTYCSTCQAEQAGTRVESNERCGPVMTNPTDAG